MPGGRYTQEEMANDVSGQVVRGQTLQGDAQVLLLVLPLLRKRTPCSRGAPDSCSHSCLLRCVPCARRKPMAFLREELDDNPGRQTQPNFSSLF